MMISLCAETIFTPNNNLLHAGIAGLTNMSEL